MGQPVVSSTSSLSRCRACPKTGCPSAALCQAVFRIQVATKVKPGRAQYPASQRKSRVLNGGFADSAFSDNKQRPIHRWVPWIAGFSAEFVRDSFARYLPANSASTAVVLDPFCGVGTTLIEAMRCGHAAIGFEVNPYAALATRAKCEAAALSPSEVSACIRKFEQYMRQPLGDAGSAAAPEHFRSRIPFFGPRARAKVLKALGFIRRLPVSPVQDLFSIAFGSVMVSLSNYSYEPSLGTRPAAGRPLQDDAPVAESIVTKLLAMNSDVAWFREELDRFARRPQGRVIPDNFLNALRHLPPASVDLLVTSPPYLNNYHYVRNTRPQLFWLGFVSRPGELKRLEHQNFGKVLANRPRSRKSPAGFRPSRSGGPAGPTPSGWGRAWVVRRPRLGKLRGQLLQ